MRIVLSVFALILSFATAVHAAEPIVSKGNAAVIQEASDSKSAMLFIEGKAAEVLFNSLQVQEREATETEFTKRQGKNVSCYLLDKEMGPTYCTIDISDLGTGSVSKTK